MKKVIPQMLFGTSYKLERKAPAMQYLIELSAEEPVRVMRMIEALDRFAEQTDKPKSHWHRLQYAILCDYTHPTSYGNNCLATESSLELYESA